MPLTALPVHPLYADDAVDAEVEWDAFAGELELIQVILPCGCELASTDFSQAEWMDTQRRLVATLRDESNPWAA